MSNETIVARRRPNSNATTAPRRLSQSERAKVRRFTSEMVRRIVVQFQPDRIILFGSQARGDPTWDSDVDLLVVMPVNGSKRAKQLEVRIALHDVHYPKDVIVVTPDEWARHKNIPGTIVRPARLEGKVLYERV
jgi:predicted nucleotidyltransferase